MSKKLSMIRIFELALLIGLILGLQSCNKNKIDTPASTEELPHFHEKHFLKNDTDTIDKDKLALYVDYSTCMMLGQSSEFFKKLLPSIQDNTRSYFSIEGTAINEHNVDSTYNLLRTIHDVNFADLKGAIDKMAEGKTESLLITDGEFFQENATKDNLCHAYMAPAFKKWLTQGHDIYFIIEPYIETYKGKQFNKKRFYIIFTDDRLSETFWDKIKSELGKFPAVDTFHLAVEHPNISFPKGEKTANKNLNASVDQKKGNKGNYEIQDWSIDWKTITQCIIEAVDEKTGKELPNGLPIISGIKIDRESLGAFKIEKIAAKVYNINAAYEKYKKDNKAKLKQEDTVELKDFICLDTSAFAKNGEVKLYFDKKNCNSAVLDGKTNNYIKIDIYVESITDVFDKYEDKFKFQSITSPDEDNVSISESIKQCLKDREIKSKITDSPIYTIYIKSLKK